MIRGCAIQNQKLLQRVLELSSTHTQEKLNKIRDENDYGFYFYDYHYQRFTKIVMRSISVARAKKPIKEVIEYDYRLQISKCKNTVLAPLFFRNKPRKGKQIF